MAEHIVLQKIAQALAVLTTTTASALVLRWLAETCYLRYVAPDFEFQMSGSSLVIPIAVYAAATAGTLVGSGVGLQRIWLIAAVFAGLAAFVILVDRRGNDDFFNATRYVMELSTGIRRMHTTSGWALIPVWGAMGTLTALGTRSFVEGNVFACLGCAVGAVIAGVLLLWLVYFPVVRSERRAYDSWQQQIMTMAEGLVAARKSARHCAQQHPGQQDAHESTLRDDEGPSAPHPGK